MTSSDPAVQSTTMASTHATIRSPITSHALNTTTGKPAKGLPVKLEWQEENREWLHVGTTVTNEDGRAPGLMAPGRVSLYI